MSTVVLDTITGKSTATTITIGSTPVVSSSANSMTIRGEGSAQTSIQQGLAKGWQIAATDGSVTDSLNTSANTDNGTGDFTFNIVNNMSSANYAINATSSQEIAAQPVMSCNPTNDTNSSSVFRLQIGLVNTTPVYLHLDKINYSSIHGDLA